MSVKEWIYQASLIAFGIVFGVGFIILISRIGF